MVHLPFTIYQLPITNDKPVASWRSPSLKNENYELKIAPARRPVC